MLTAYHIANVIGTKSMKKNISMLKDAVDKSEEIGDLFRHFTCHEWIFDNKNTLTIWKSLSEEEKKNFNFDVT